MRSLQRPDAVKLDQDTHMWQNLLCVTADASRRKKNTAQRDLKGSTNECYGMRIKLPQKRVMHTDEVTVGVWFIKRYCAITPALLKHHS